MSSAILILTGLILVVLAAVGTMWECLYSDFNHVDYTRRDRNR